MISIYLTNNKLMNYYLVSAYASGELLIQAQSSYDAVKFFLSNCKGEEIILIKEVYKEPKILSKIGPLYVYGFEYEGCAKRYVIASDLRTVSAYYPEAIKIWKDSPYKVTIIDESGKLIYN